LTVASFGTVVPNQTSYGVIVNTVEVAKIEVPTKIAVSDVESTVRSYFADIPVMIQVARCESTFRHTQEDGSVLRGVVDGADTGVMQINKRYHETSAAARGLDLNDIYDNMAYARHLYETQGTQPWSASAPCWNPTMAMNI
jgi:hypothetical protein